MTGADCRKPVRTGIATAYYRRDARYRPGPSLPVRMASTWSEEERHVPVGRGRLRLGHALLQKDGGGSAGLRGRCGWVMLRSARLPRPSSRRSG